MWCPRQCSYTPAPVVSSAIGHGVYTGKALSLPYARGDIGVVHGRYAGEFVGAGRSNANRAGASRWYRTISTGRGRGCSCCKATAVRAGGVCHGAVGCGGTVHYGKGQQRGGSQSTARGTRIRTIREYSSVLLGKLSSM